MVSLYAVNSDDFISTVKQSDDWKLMDTYNTARKDDDESTVQPVHRFSSATITNTSFTRTDCQGYTFLTYPSGEVVELSVTGFVTQVNLGPFTEVFAKQRSNMHPGKFIQSITITGAGDETFKKSIAAIRHISKYLQQSGADIRALDPFVPVGGQYPTITASARLLTPAQFNRTPGMTEKESVAIFESHFIPRSLDPSQLITAAVATRTHEYTSDNFISLYKLLSIQPDDPSTWRFVEAHSPAEIAVGNLVELTMSFKVAPFSKSRKVMCHLVQVNRIGIEATSKLDELQEEQTATQQMSQLTLNDVKTTVTAPKRRMGGEGRFPKVARLMNVDTPTK